MSRRERQIPCPRGLLGTWGPLTRLLWVDAPERVAVAQGVARIEQTLAQGPKGALGRV